MSEAELDAMLCAGTLLTDVVEATPILVAEVVGSWTLLAAVVPKVGASWLLRVASRGKLIFLSEDIKRKSRKLLTCHASAPNLGTEADLPRLMVRSEPQG